MQIRTAHRNISQFLNQFLLLRFLTEICFSFYLQALRNEQERTLADMRERHEQDTHKINEKLEREVVTEEAQAVELLEADKERKLRELKDRHAAELAARSKDMSPEEVQQVFEERSLFCCSKCSNVVYSGQCA